MTFALWDRIGEGGKTAIDEENTELNYKPSGEEKCSFQLNGNVRQIFHFLENSECFVSNRMVHLR